jgi:hypothetical protein
MNEKDQLANAISPELAEKSWSARESWRISALCQNYFHLRAGGFA